jgi:hypothetical protein
VEHVKLPRKDILLKLYRNLMYNTWNKDSEPGTSVQETVAYRRLKAHSGHKSGPMRNQVPRLAIKALSAAEVNVQPLQPEQSKTTPESKTFCYPI